MPVPSTRGQPELLPGWFATAPALALLASEQDSVDAALAERPGQAWLWLSPVSVGDGGAPGHGLHLHAAADGWAGAVRCALPLPLANESVAAVVIQHAAAAGRHADVLLAECARVLVPGGRLSLFCLNPLSPWRWRWAGGGPGASEPMPWRRRLRAAGLVPDPVSHGLGPRWGLVADASLQEGAGVRAAWLLRAEKRVVPLTGLRSRARLRIGSGVPVA